MPKVPITMPQLGESMAEATIVAIKVQPGDKVAADQEIIEVETDKAVMGITTPCPGEIATIDAEVKGVYAVGAVLGYVEASEADAARFVKNAPEPTTAEVAREVPGREEESAEAQNGSGSHFQVDETSLPQVAAGSHFQVDQSRSAARARKRERRGLSLSTGEGAHGRAAIDAGRSRGNPGKRKRRAGYDQGSGIVSSAAWRNKPRKTQARSAPAWPMR